MWLSVLLTEVVLSALEAPSIRRCSYTSMLDISDLVALEEVQKELGLGPNGGMLYCMDYLAENLDWLEAKMAELKKGRLCSSATTLAPARSGLVIPSEPQSTATFWWTVLARWSCSRPMGPCGR